ncbi:hypothetical protein FJY71_00415 [candidate division WOR-3 bacterium]|nr:hypothetical protein [candidate division WOR-3 bacterium]
MTQDARDTYKYYYKDGNRILHAGITTDLDRREQQHQQKWPSGHICQVGRRTTEDAARDWEAEQKQMPGRSRKVDRRG